MTAPADIESWIDKQAIRETVARYSSAATRGAWDELEALWMTDGVWEVAPPVGTKVVGSQAIREAASGNADKEDFLFQMTHDTVVTLHGAGKASAKTTIHALARREGDHHFMNMGIYYDDLVKHEGAWKFARRILQPIYVESEKLNGQVAIARAKIR